MMLSGSKGHMDALENMVGKSDMCLIEPLTEDNVIENLKLRFNNNHIYTYIGSVVVSVNPYCPLPLYTREAIFDYRSRNIYELPPHIYAIADEAYRSMRDRNLDQCVIITGESGSGKTEASKVIMQYVAAVSGKGKDIDRVKEQLLQSNPVLEAFGNAKTNRNDNSSRFGKYMDIEFDFKGDPIGGVITNYLLEKSRVVEQGAGERSFHIFYQLLAGAETSFLKSLKLQRNPEHYYFLTNDNNCRVSGVDDKDAFHKVMGAMEVIGFRREETAAVFQLVSAVLKLGNVQFKHHANMDGTDGCQLINEHEVLEVCDLLQSDLNTLVLALTSRTVYTIKDYVRTDLNSTEAVYARDALCKAVYSRLFTWLVQRINDSIRVRSRSKKKALGVLDIYGFEIFEKNSFEQFIINYCNEKLQQIFIELTLKEEQEEYIREGIEWIHVDYFNNAVICELIEKNNTGMLAMIDEECLRPGRVDDFTLLEKLNRSCGQHVHYESRGCRKNLNDKSIPHDSFRLVHYAGMVTYQVEGFIDKNNDLLFKDLSRAMYSCEHSLLKDLFPEGNPSRRSLKRPPTTGSQFKNSVSELMKNLLSKSPNYIRCIKSNDFKKQGIFDDKLVRHQVRYLGLCENIRVKRAGYAFRQKYMHFLYRYKMLAAATWPHYPGEARDGVEELLDTLCISAEEYAFGRTKIFVTNPNTLFDLEEMRKEKMHDLAILIQTVWRGHSQQQKYRALRAAEIRVASYYRMYRARTEYQRIRTATLVLCKYARGWKARQIYKELKFQALCVWAVSIIHKYYLGWRVRREYRKKFRAIAGPKIISFLQKFLRYRFLMELRSQLPLPSPTDKRWPKCSPLHKDTSVILQKLHHRNRCLKYMKCDNGTRKIMREKITASDLFKDRKASYPPSVGHPFNGDYISLSMNAKWKKNACDTNDQQLVFADVVSKVNRKDGKAVPHVLAVSTSALQVLDQRTLVAKCRIPISSVEAISLSPFHDKLVAFHIKKQDKADSMTKKGDFLLSSDHVIEIVSKLYLLIKNSTDTPPNIHITTQIVSVMRGHNIEITFKPGVPDLPLGAFKIVRKGGRMEVHVA